MLKTSLVIVLASVQYLLGCAQLQPIHHGATAAAKPWNGKTAAVVLTYDDGLNVHLKYAVPVLDSLHLKGTFYLTHNFGSEFGKQVPGWKLAAANGHELGNHSMYHPCEGGRPGREWVQPEYDLRNYTVKRMTDDVHSMNTLLTAIDGKSERTFALPCGDRTVNDTPYVHQLGNELIAIRGVRGVMPTLPEVELMDLPCYMIAGNSGAEMKALVDKAIEKKALLVFLFHGVGGEHGLNVDLDAHRQLLYYLKQRQSELWIAPMIDVARYVAHEQKK